jgi:hypothetical protein
MTFHNRGWRRGLAAMVLLSAGFVSAETRSPSVAAKPADIDPVSWTALQNAIADTLPPASTELTASDGAAFDQFGQSVSLSGITALVGAPLKIFGSKAYQGAAYVFTFDGSSWVQQQELTASDGAGGDEFGWSVALSGTTALVGASYKTIGANSRQGAAYVFTFNGSTWVQQQELTASDGAGGDAFGWSVALSGTTALVGGPGHSIGSSRAQGAAYVFTFNGSSWVQKKELTASDGAEGDSFGWSVALSGATALVGAFGKTIGSNLSQGAAYVFAFDGSTWARQQELTANNGAARDNFGLSVALSGTTTLVGADNKTIGSNDSQGAAYVFAFNSSTWVQQQQLSASNGVAGQNFGASVALSDTTALVGAFEGAPYVFEENAGTWVQVQELNASAVGDEFGTSVALSGATALVGAYGAMVGSNTAQGAAYVFSEAIFCDGFDGAGPCK